MSVIEAQQVICLRMLKLMIGGPTAQREAARMVAEKLDAATESGVKFALGATPRKVMSGYRRKVRANRRRLLRSP